MLRLREADLASIRAHGAAEYPLECCGVLLGNVRDEMKFVTEVRPLANVFEPDVGFERLVNDAAEGSVGQERRFMVAPSTMLKLMKEERATGVRVLGFYHSHPNHPALPSEYDRVWAAPWYSYVIVSVQSGEPCELTSWTLIADGSAFEAEEWEVNGVQQAGGDDVDGRERERS